MEIERLMSSKSQTITELKVKLDAVENFLSEIDESEALPDEQIRDFQMTLTMLQIKHIPPELCSEIKLWERTEEVSTLMEDIKWELEQLGKNR